MTRRPAGGTTESPDGPSRHRTWQCNTQLHETSDYRPPFGVGCGAVVPLFGGAFWGSATPF